MTGYQNICHSGIRKKCRFIFLWIFCKMVETEMQSIFMSCIIFGSDLAKDRNIKLPVKIIFRRYLNNIADIQCFHCSLSHTSITGNKNF